MPQWNAQQLRRETGATFVETIIASAIVIVVLVSVIAIIGQATRYLANIRLTARSSQILQQKMEDIRLMSWSSIEAMPTTFSDPSDTNNIFAGAVSLADYDTFNGTSTVKRVTLTVTWVDRNSRVATNKLSTLIANGGLNRYIF
jgi:Tfp pilus assembly protein PilV